MIVVDTSVWIDHFRRGNRTLVQLLAEDQVRMHPYVVGELACGTLRQRHETLALLQSLPAIGVVSDAEALFYLDHQRLYGKGLGYIDLHLLAATAIAGAELWSLDRALQRQATALRVAYGGLE